MPLAGQLFRFFIFTISFKTVRSANVDDTIVSSLSLSVRVRPFEVIDSVLSESVTLNEEGLGKPVLVLRRPVFSTY